MNLVVCVLMALIMFKMAIGVSATHLQPLKDTVSLKSVWELALWWMSLGSQLQFNIERFKIFVNSLPSSSGQCLKICPVSPSGPTASHVLMLCAEDICRLKDNYIKLSKNCFMSSPQKINCVVML